MEYTDNFKQILEKMQAEACRLQKETLTPELLLLTLLSQEGCRAQELLTAAGVNISEAQNDLQSRLLPDAEAPTLYHFDKPTQRVLRMAELQAKTRKAEAVGSEHILLGLLYDKLNPATGYLSDRWHVTYDSLTTQIAPKEQSKPQASAGFDSDLEDDRPREEQPINSDKKEENSSKTPALDRYGKNLTAAAEGRELDPVVGREREIERVVQILSRRRKNNPILIGEPGVGKSAIVEGLALRIVGKQVSPILQGKLIYTLDIASMVAGTTYRGQFEERMKNVISELRNHPEIILFIDEIHTMIGAGNASGSLDAAGILKPALARGEVQCIGATTISEYRKSIEKDGALERRFQKVVVAPTTKEETYLILQQLSAAYGQHHGITYPDEVLHACIELSDRYLTDRSFPDKAIDTLDEVGARAQVQQKTTVSIDDVAHIISLMSGVPTERIETEENTKLRNMAAHLKERIIGQDEAVDAIVKAIQRSRLGLKDPNRPIGTFFLLGPTGVGKTHLAQCLAEELFGQKDALIRLDMSEYVEKHTTSLLVGAPPGYLAHEDGGKLTEAVRRKPYSILLFDEIEKAHPDIFNILLQVLDEGRLTDRQGKVVDFRNTVILLTSNVGTRDLREQGNGIGFKSSDQIDEKKAKEILMKALQKQFPPEFVNRLDSVVAFRSLSKDDLNRIIDLELHGLEQRLTEMGFTLHVSEEVRAYLINKSDCRQYGARPLRRAIQNEIEDALTSLLLEPERGTAIQVTLTDGKTTAGWTR